MAFDYFPIVCHWLNDEMMIGTVLSTDIVVADKSSKSVKKLASDAITRTLREGYLDAPDLNEPELHMHKVDVQLSYRQEGNTYPLAKPTPFTVAAVYGNLNDTFGECYLPFFDVSFYYYSHEQRSGLIKHYTREFLQRLSPEQAYQYSLTDTPWLEIVRVKSDQPEVTWSAQKDLPQLLKEVCEPAIGPKKARRKHSRLPSFAWERNQEANQLANLLLVGKENILLVGGHGVGKTTLLNEACSIVARDKTNTNTLWRSSCQRIIGKAKYLGEWQAICDELVEGLAELNGILWVSDFMALLYTGGESEEDSVASYLHSSLLKGQLRLVGEISHEQLDHAKQRLPGFIHLFKVLTIGELSVEQTKKVLTLYSDYAENNLQTKTTQSAIDLCFQLTQRYIKYQKRPGNVLGFFSHCIKQADVLNTSIITPSFMVSQFVDYTGLPEMIFRDDYLLSKEAIGDFFKERIKGQNTVIDQLVTIVQLFKAGLNDPHRPIATLLFAGPTGVGKTAATKALSEYFFSSGQKKNPLFTLDMSEFQQPWQVERLIGHSRAPSKLISHVRNQPFSVILLDEIEKAHPSVFDMLLTLLDEGLLTDRNGRLTDFRSSIIIMTSNLGAGANKAPGFINSEEAGVNMAAVKQHFRPEFFNRLDQVLNFQPLSHASIMAIAERELHLLKQRDRIQQHNITLTFSEALINFIATKGFSKDYGARPIQRAIEKYVVGPLARYMMANPNLTNIVIGYDGNTVMIQADAA